MVSIYHRYTSLKLYIHELSILYIYHELIGVYISCLETGFVIDFYQSNTHIHVEAFITDDVKQSIW